MSGPALMVVTTIAFVILDAIVKWLSGTYGVMQIVAMRSTVSALERIGRFPLLRGEHRAGQL